MTTARRVLVMLLAALTLIGGGIATAGAASATSPQCNTYDAREYNKLVPYYSGGATARCYLSSGSTGDGVKALQTALALCYGQDLGPYGIDGVYGWRTVQALKNVQAYHGITADGRYGPQTHNTISFHGYGNGAGTPFCLPTIYKV